MGRNSMAMLGLGVLLGVGLFNHEAGRFTGWSR
jgi:hypothetical protein